LNKAVSNREYLPEIGGILGLEHFNFEGASHDLATIFFMNGLGFTRDPYRRTDETNMGVNIGMQQFHLPQRGNPTPPFFGEIGLVVPDLPVIKARLDRLAANGQFEGTPYELNVIDESTLHVMSPFGVGLKLHAAGSLDFLRPLGIAYIDIPIKPGKAAALETFYRELVQTPTQLVDIEGEATLVVTYGPYQFIRFREREIENYHLYSFHVAYFVTNYNAYRERVIEQGALQGEGAGQVFFFEDLFDPESGEVIVKFGQEVRSIYHPDFMRPLVNRWPIIAEPFSDQREVMESLADVPGLVYGDQK
jgi:hypothetical protein